jgi:hypothetical protein
VLGQKLAELLGALVIAAHGEASHQDDVDGVDVEIEEVRGL